MKGDKIRYKSGYKYQLVETYILEDCGIYPKHDIHTDFISLYSSGKLEIIKGYAWDGPSGPTIDTPDSMRASLVHDAIYQLIRMRLISESCRALADRLLHQLCLEDGMHPLRADAWFHAVDLLAAGCARSGTERPILEAP